MDLVLVRLGGTEEDAGKELDGLTSASSLWVRGITVARIGIDSRTMKPSRSQSPAGIETSSFRSECARILQQENRIGNRRPF
jgi:hypothetical protein